ncbi:MAG: hypothetical protein CMI26_06985, partial [Opitutae bacterium]|nr:hypothetical protein [Opitutae bacterium]
MLSPTRGLPTAGKAIPARSNGKLASVVRTAHPSPWSTTCFTQPTRKASSSSIERIPKPLNCWQPTNWATKPFHLPQLPGI